MEYRGKFEDGIIRPDQPLAFPDGTPVEFHAIEASESKGKDRKSRSPDTATPVADLEALDRLARSHGSLEDIIREQGIDPIRSLDDLVVPGLEDEDVDAFIKSIKEGRR